MFLRPIRSSDGHLLVDLFNRMSAQSVYLRFLRRLDTLSENMIHQFLKINYHSDFALVAVVKEDEKDTIVAVGRYGYDPEEDSTDLAVAVRDDVQGEGLGELMLSKVVTIAKENGIARFTGIMDSRNKAIQKLLVKLGYKVSYSMESGFYKVVISA